jgi:hypothetical protein
MEDPMTQKSEIKREMEETLAHLRTVRDEIRVHLHLAGMEAKESFAKLDADLDQADLWIEQATDASSAALHKVGKALRSFRDSFKDEPKGPAAHS